MRVVMPGGSGHVGRSVRRWLEPEGWRFDVVSRTPRAGEHGWDALPGLLDGADVVLNLAGRSVNCRYTAENLREMMASRVDSVAAVARAVRAAPRPPRVWLQASTATIYAHRYDAPNDEATGVIGGDPPRWAPSVRIAQAWEDALAAADVPGTRKVALRSSLTLSVDEGSIFDVLATLARRGLGGTSGDGRQYVSWIHEEDFARALRHAVERDALEGPVNVCAPNPLPNREFARILRQAVGAPFGPPAPRPLLEVGTWLMRTETELVLKSRRVVPARLLESGFAFRYPEWADAARELAARL